jgi:hypothetical protein
MTLHAASFPNPIHAGDEFLAGNANMARSSPKAWFLSSVHAIQHKIFRKLAPTVDALSLPGESDLAAARLSPPHPS